MNELIQKQIREIVSNNKETESCGLLVYSEDSEETLVLPCRNIANNQAHNFTIHPKDYLKASLKGKIVGCYHVHVNENETFSMKDRISAANLKLPFILYHLPTDQFYQLNENNAYFTKNYEPGIFDCYTLVKNYYKNELNKELPNIDDYEKYFANFEFNLQADYNRYGFKEVSPDCARRHDILLFNFYRTVTPPHFAVYLGNGYFLHHPRNGCPQIEFLSPILSQKIVCCLQCNI